MQDTFIQENLISKRELAEDILTVHKYLRSEQFLKLIIKRKRCQEFVACMQEFPELEHINERIREFKNTYSSVGNTMNGISLYSFLYYSLFSFVIFFDFLFLIIFWFWFCLLFLFKTVLLIDILDSAEKNVWRIAE